MDNTDPAPEPRPMYTPEFAAKQRRSTFWSMIVCIGMGAALLVAAVYAKDHGGTVTGGHKGGLTKYPWWMVAPVGAGLAALGIWGLWRHATRRDA